MYSKDEPWNPTIVHLFSLTENYQYSAISNVL